jgi:hypothetical protein
MPINKKRHILEPAPNRARLRPYLIHRGFERFGHVCQDMVYVHSSFDRTLKPVRYVKMCYGDDEKEDKHW